MHSCRPLAYDLAVFRTRRLHEDLPVERVRSRVGAYIYGNILVLAAIFATSSQSIAHWSAVFIVVATSPTSSPTTPAKPSGAATRRPCVCTLPKRHATPCRS